MKLSDHHPCQLRCEYLDNPSGIDEPKPRLSWQLFDPRQGAAQTAYHITAASSLEKLDSKPDLWDSKPVNSDQCIDIVYSGKRLTSRQTVWWRVRYQDHNGVFSRWSEPACFGIGLLKPEDWTAKWIGRPLQSIENADTNPPCPFLRRQFTIDGKITRSRVFVTARGIFELHINGIRVGAEYFTPGWTDYSKRIQYMVYDVTHMLQPGANTIGAILNDGWYAGTLGWKNGKCTYGDQLSLLLQMEIEHPDGSIKNIITDENWKTAFGPLVKSDFYDGEIYDARQEMPGWNSNGYDDSGWDKAAVFPPPKAALTARRNRPVLKQEELAVLKQTEPSFGVHVFDLGQNMVGWARVKVRAPVGTCVRIRYAEMLKDDGTLYTENLRKAKCTDYYICKGGGEETYEPLFTFHGFRYVELTGLVEKPVSSDITGVVLHSDIPPTGSFECSDPLVNRLQQNITWGQRGNFLEVPTDCPQRDERLGWTGDAQVFIRTATFNRDVSAFFTKWCIDLEDSQLENGAFPHIAPNIMENCGEGCAAWADAGVICPWTIYLCYGDKGILDRHYKSMARWIEWRRKTSRNLIHSNACFGDWLAVDSIGNSCGESKTPRDLIATAYFAYTTAIVSRIAAILERKADAKKYAALARNVKTAFNREFVAPSGRVVGDSQTGYLLALAFDLLPPGKRQYAVELLAADIENRGCHLSTGFVGTPLLAPVLSKFGRTDLAYKLLFQQTYPSWLYTVLQGATTMWERWNSYTKEHGFGDASMNSFNHYAYGAIGEWIYNTVAGIELDPDKPGYKHIIIKPEPCEQLKWARGELITRYGPVSCEWKRTGKKLKFKVGVPPNTSATVILPGKKPFRISAGLHNFS